MLSKAIDKSKWDSKICSSKLQEQGKEQFQSSTTREKNRERTNRKQETTWQTLVLVLSIITLNENALNQQISDTHSSLQKISLSLYLDRMSFSIEDRGRVD